MIINQTYSGGGIELSLVISVTSGSVVTAVKGGKSVTGVSVDGVCVLTVPEAGTWTVSATLGGKTTPAQAIQVVDQYPAALEYPLYVEELSVGDSVWMDPASASASKIEFLVVHQGKPMHLTGQSHCRNLIRSDFSTAQYLLNAVCHCVPQGFAVLFRIACRWAFYSILPACSGYTIPGFVYDHRLGA